VSASASVSGSVSEAGEWERTVTGSGWTKERIGKKEKPAAVLYRGGSSTNQRDLPPAPFDSAALFS
jgi:hypothetical protein